MQDTAYDAMRQMQERHWWWRGMRRLYRTALTRFLPPAVPQNKRRVIDVGCGFGANLPVLQPLGDLVCVDVSPEALQTIDSTAVLGRVQAAADALPFRAESFDVVGLLAVVEHVDRDDRVLTEAYRVARPNGIQILLTSAFMLLWSHHDRANNHRRRYRAAQLDRLQHAAGWQVLITSYANTFVFPVVALVRMLQRRFSSAQAAEAAAYDMGPEMGPFNAALEGLLALEAWLITHRMKLPFGVDLFSVARRKDNRS